MKKHVFLSVTFVALVAFVNAYATPTDTATPPKAHKTALNTKAVSTKKNTQ